MTQRERERGIESVGETERRIREKRKGRIIQGIENWRIKVWEGSIAKREREWGRE